MKSSLYLRYLVFVTLFASGLVVGPLVAQTFTDGPMNLQVRVGYLYIDNYYDVFGGNQEPVYYVYVADDANHDGQGWRNSAGCIDKDCACYLWRGQPGGYSDEVIMNHDYGTNVPQRLDFEMENWEDDAGTDCSYNGPCSICVDPDDAYCSRRTLANDVYYRNSGLPCTWFGATDVAWGPYDFGICSNQWAVGLQFKWQFNGSVTGTYYWRGQNSSNWYEACNWSTSTVPNSTRDVVIPASGYTFAPTIASGTAYCNTIEIQGSTVVTIVATSGAVLQVTQ